MGFTRAMNVSQTRSMMITMRQQCKKCKNTVRAVLCLAVLLLTGASQVLDAASAQSQGEGFQEASLDERNKWEFKPFSKDLRDPFRNIEAVAGAKADLREFLAKRDEEKGGGIKDSNVPSRDENLLDADADELERALARAGDFSVKSEQYLLEREWRGAVREAEKGVEELNKVSQLSSHPKYKKVVALLKLLNGYLKNARTAQLNEEAERRFNALNLQVQGIMWSADRKSLAIISGKHFYVQDKIGEGDDGEVTIVNIDPHRVDFMINYKRRRFEFKRFIGE